MKIREELVCFSKDEYLITSLLLWSLDFTLYQVILLRKERFVQGYIRIEEEYHTFSLQLSSTKLKEDVVFDTLASMIRALLIDLQKHSEKQATVPVEYKIWDVPLDALFLKDVVIQAYRKDLNKDPFYVLAPNFNTIRKWIQEGEKPSMFEEVMRLKQKYRR